MKDAEKHARGFRLGPDMLPHPSTNGGPGQCTGRVQDPTAYPDSASLAMST